jgi:hypothetical protein
MSSLAPSLVEDKAFPSLEASSYPEACDNSPSLVNSVQLLAFLSALLLNVAFAPAFNRYNSFLDV